MRPECALAGTVTMSPAELERRWAPGELRLIVAPADLGKATSIPAFRPAPWTRSVPFVETWCGLPEHLEAGVQLTWMIRTLVTWALTVGAAAFVGAAGAEVPGAEAPPGPAAAAAGATASSSAANIAVRNFSRTWVAVSAKFIGTR